MRRKIKGLEPIMSGRRILKLDVGCIQFIDSLLLFQRPLADLSKTFDLSSGEKGFFPHYLNTKSNQALICQLSAISEEDFGCPYMSTKRAIEFDK